MRAIGVICVFVFGTCVGQEVCKRLKQRRSAQELWLQTWLAIRGEIRYKMADLPELCERFGATCDDAVGRFFHRLGDGLSYTSWCAVWDSASLAAAKELGIDATPLMQLGQQWLGQDRQTMQQQITLYLEALQRQLDGEREDYGNRLKVTRALSVAGSLVAALLLL